ncbi:alpha-2-macroglobulin [Campylobacter showae]|uniref:alpha-2-macroglobulin family protein n=1 Tax=Campylobacter showae TaxID=204 RepID=UPI0028D6F3A3|nr:alpha-2-macroglobulin [Campylobacter showae]
MRLKLVGLSLSCILVANLSAFTLDGSSRALDDGSVSIGVKYAQNEQSLIGKVTHKKIIECSPEITGAFEYGSDSIFFYPKKPLAKGISYSCKKGDSKVKFYGGDFVLSNMIEYSGDTFLAVFNDEVSEDEFAANFKIYDKQNLAKQNIKYKIVAKTPKSFQIKLLESGDNLVFSVSKNLKNTSGINLADSFEVVQKVSNPDENFVDKPKAKTMFLNEVEGISLDNGKLAARLYLKDWIDSDNVKKFIKVEGVNSFEVGEMEYTSHQDANGEYYYYYIDITSKDFKPQTTYKVTFYKGFGDDYSMLRENSSFNVAFGDLKPFLEFTDSGTYMSSLGEIGIKSVNTNTAKVVVEKLKEQNLRYFLNFTETPLDNYAEEVASKNYEIGGAQNEMQKSKIKLDFAEGGDGVYLVTVYYDKDKSVQKAVYLTDIGLSMKVSKDEVFLFANRLSKNEVVANADVKIYSTKNNLIASGITNDEGVFKFNKKDIGKDVSSAVLTLGKEQSFIALSQNKRLNEESNLDAKDRSETYSAYLHFASNIIRPQENIKGEIIIKNALFKSLSNMPVKLKIKDPQNKTILDKGVNTTELGVINFDEPVNSGLTGTFKFEVIFANKIIDSYDFSVESFTPQRIKNDVSLEKEIYALGDVMDVKLQSAYLFGGVAANLKGDVTINLYQQDYKNDKFKEYKFSNGEYAANGLDQSVKQVELDDEGKGETVFRLENKSKIASILKGTAVFTINDDGKNVSASKSFSVYPFDAMVGIRANDTYIDANSKLTLNFVSVDPLKDEELKDRQKAIEIKKEIWDYNYDKDGYLRWHSRYEKVFSDTLSGNEFVYDFKQSGDYVVTVSDILSGHSANLNVYVSGWDYGGTLQPTKELAKAKIKLNQKVYKKGDSLNVDVSSVLKSGIGIITVESENVKKYKVVNIENNVANAKFDLDFDFEGLYVTASIMRVADNDVLPFRTYDKVYAKADKSYRATNVSIEAPKVVKSNSKFKTTVKTEPNAEVTLFAVDEGVLQVTNQKLKSPLDFFDKILNDGVLDYDIYANLSGFKKDGKVLNFGGDAAAALMEMRMAKFASPVDKKNVKTYIKMQTAKAGADGVANFDVEVPSDFNSEINLAVLSVIGDKLGFSVNAVKVKDDIILKPTQTAYLINGDKINYSLRVINTTKEPKKVALSLDTNLNAKLGVDSIELKPEENAKLNFTVDANATGRAYINFTANDGKEGYSYSQKLDVISAYPLSTYAKTFYASEKKTFKLDEGLNDITIDASSSIKGVLSANSDKLVNYPYGCAEQRSSKLFELNFLTLGGGDSKEAKAREADRKRFVLSGMQDVIKMQKTDGSIGYWNQLSYTNNFASVYAIDMLLTLEKSGFALDSGVKSKALGWLRDFDPVNNFQALYAAYILSTQGKLDRSKLNALYDQKRYEGGALEGYLMAATLKNEGLTEESKKVLKGVSDNFFNEQSDDPSDFGSNVRNKAFILLLHANHFEKNEFSDSLADFLIKNVDKLYSTQERAFTLRALRAYIKDVSSENKFKLIADGRELDFSGRGAINVTPKKAEITIVPEGNASVYLGVSASGYKKLGVNHKFDKRGLDIYRTFVDEDGKEIDINALKVNDVIYSKLTLRTDKFIRNGVINETISPCFEVINENIVPNARTEATKSSLTLEHQNIEDDRVLSFYSLYYNDDEDTLYTPLRVVMSGKCMLPAVITENMYDESMSDYDLAQHEFIVK